MQVSLAPQAVESSFRRHGRTAAWICALIMWGLAAYGFTFAEVILPLSEGRMILNGAAAYWAAGGEALLGLGIACIPFCKPRPERATITCGVCCAAGVLLLWTGTLLS